MIKYLILLPFLTFGQSKLTTDDNLHFMAGVNISNAVGSSVFYATKKPFISCLAGFGASVLAGAGKELIYDKMMNKGHCDIGDFTTTVWGGLWGSVTLRIGINIFYEKKHIFEP